MAKEFYNELISYVSKSDTSNANALLMKEIGKCLAKNKSDFAELLTSSGVAANEGMSDVDLIDLFVNNIPSNKSLMIGSAYMINKSNCFLGADGEPKVSDEGVKVTYKVMNDFFDAPDSESEFSNFEEHSNVVAAIAHGVGALAGLGTKIAEGQQKKKYGAQEALAKQSEAKSQIVQAVIAQRQAEAKAKQDEADRKAKTKKILLIGGAGLLGIALIGFVIYKLKNK